MVAKVFKRGAFDFIEKPFNSQILLDRVQDALTRDIQFRIRLADKENTRAKLALLTKREQEVMNLIVEGKLNKVIASELGLSQRTIEVHRANIMEKLGVGSVAELVTLVHKTLTNDDV
jgi:FixJ family two-component response regulator